MVLAKYNKQNSHFFNTQSSHLISNFDEKLKYMFL